MDGHAAHDIGVGIDEIRQLGLIELQVDTGVSLAIEKRFRGIDHIVIRVTGQ